MDFTSSMAEAKKQTEIIYAYHSQCASDPINPSRSQNPVNTAKHAWFDVVLASERAISIYHHFNQREKAQALVNNVIEIAQTCDMFTSYLAIRLYLSLAGHTSWLQKFAPDLATKLKAAMSATIGLHLHELETRFWVLARDKSDASHMGTFEFWRDLATTDAERDYIDIKFCQTMELAAYICELRDDWHGVSSWYDQAARFCQERLGDADRGTWLLHKASEARWLQLQMPINPNFLKALEAEAPDSPEYVAAMNQLSIEESLSVIQQMHLKEQHSIRFLPTLEDFKVEYAQESDKLTKLCQDSRLIIDYELINTRQSSFLDSGLLNIVEQIQITDLHQNVRGNIPSDSRFVLQYISEIEEIINGLLLEWQQSGLINNDDILSRIKQKPLLADWQILAHGVTEYLRNNYLSSTHILIPQFENLVRLWAQSKAQVTKQLKHGIAGEKLFNQLIHPENHELKAMMGEGLFDLIYWYLADGAGPLGYRHKVAHGWITPAQASSSQLSAMSIYMMLRMIALSV